MNRTHILENPANILIVDDDLDIRQLLAEYLEDHGYKTYVAANGTAMWNILQNSNIHLVVLDLNLPGENGFQLCKQFREKSDLPIIMLTARSASLDRILGLEMGADDYVCKPFEPRELLSRIRNVLRRMQMTSEEKKAVEPKRIHFANWTLDVVARHLVNSKDVIISLSGAEYRLLQIFLDHANQVLNRDHLLNLTQGRDADPFDRVVDIQVSRLRQKIEVDSKNPQIIKTVRNEGYVLATAIEIES
ncbi:MAG: response regulator [Methylophilaceae bacterium]|nr:response regulator [Methyloradius sp.]